MRTSVKLNKKAVLIVAIMQGSYIASSNVESGIIFPNIIMVNTDLLFLYGPVLCEKIFV